MVPAAASRRSSHYLVACTTVGADDDSFRRRVKTRNMLLTRASTRLEVRATHLALDFFFPDSSRMPAARVRRALPNLTTVGGGLSVGGFGGSFT